MNNSLNVMFSFSTYGCKRGVSPVIAILLLIVISVASAVLFYLWTTGYFGKVSEASEASETMGSMLKAEGVKVEDSTLVVFVRNVGRNGVNVDKLFIMKNEIIAYALDVENGPVEIKPGNVAEIRATIPSDFEAGKYTLKIGSAGGIVADVQLYYSSGASGGGQPENWLQGWSYRRQITITEQSGNTLIGYQVKIVLTSGNFDYSKAEDDGSDLRFTDSDGTTLLPYWIENWNPGGESVIWVRVSEIPANDEKIIYMYYGNLGASSESNAESTFDEGILMHTKYNTKDPANLNQQIQYWNQAVDTDGYGWEIIQSFDNVSNHATIGGSKTNIAFNWWCVFYVDTPGTWNFRYGPDAGWASSEFIDRSVRAETYDDRWWNYNWGSSDVIYFSAGLDEGWHVLEILAFEGCCDGGQSLQFKPPGGGDWTTFSTSNLQIRTHKYVSPEPTIIVGSEESA